MSDEKTQPERTVERGDRTETIIQSLSDSAEAGDAEAQFRLGLLYYRGKDVEFDERLAWDWLERADQNDHMKAAYYIGRLCTACGEHEIAMKWYQRRSELGVHSACAHT